MFGVTRRQRVFVAIVFLAGAVSAVTALLGWERVALAGLAGIATLGVVMLLDVRTGQRALARHVRTMSGRQAKHLAVHERRLLAAVEGARVDSLDGFAGLQAAHKRLAKGNRAQAREQVRETEALLQLYRGGDVGVPMPPAGGFALRPTGLLNLVSLIERVRPALVVELGSGTSTIWVATILRKLGRGRLVSFDHLEDYAERTRGLLRLHQLDDVAEVRCAQLRPVDLGDAKSDWYDANQFQDVCDIDLLVVDGPPKSVGEFARRPALPMLQSRLSNGAWIVVDDAGRKDEVRMVAGWLEDTPSLTRRLSLVGDQILLTYERPAT